MFLSYIVLQLFLITVYGMCIAISQNKCFVLHVTTFRTVCAVPHIIILFQFNSSVPNMADVSGSSILCCPGMSLRYYVNDLEMVPLDPITTGIGRVHTFYRPRQPLGREEV
jgi:hypothetical protein